MRQKHISGKTELFLHVALGILTETFRAGTVQHVANLIPTLGLGKKLDQLKVESFQTKEWSLNTS